jgi:GT2 family glycosyltransferase
MAIRRDLFHKLGGFDPRYFVYHSDFDLGLRIQQAGLRQVVLGSVVVPHDDGGSSELPQMWTWDKRGRAWTRFLRNTRNLPQAFGSSLILFVGYAMRTVAYTITGRRNKARELRTYLTSGIKEWLKPTPETTPPSRDAGPN